MERLLTLVLNYLVGPHLQRGNDAIRPADFLDKFPGNMSMKSFLFWDNTEIAATATPYPCVTYLRAEAGRDWLADGALIWNVYV